MGKKLEKAIAEIMDNFDFDSTYRVMKLLDRKWIFGYDGKRIPTVDEIKELTEGYLREAWKVAKSSGKKRKGECSCGGFEAARNGDLLSLKFVIEEYHFITRENE